MKDSQKERLVELAKQNDEALTEFDDLLEIAIDTCLADRANYERHLSDIRHTSFAENTGIWVTRATMEMETNGSIYGKFSTDKYKDIADGLSPPLPEASPSVQTRIEAFGRSMLDEAFGCLGEDASDQALAFASAETAEEQVEVVNWLLERLYDIRIHSSTESGLLDSVDSNTDNRESEEDDKFYHPIRLSPKLLGCYPNINKIEPTCLGYSILVSAFFEKAGAKYFHAGVMRTTTEYKQMLQYDMLQQMHDFFEESNTGVSDRFTDGSIKFIEAYDRRTLQRCNQFHAANMVNLKDGFWMQIDPNYNSNFINYNTLHDERLSKLYSLLVSSSDTVAGMEVGVLANTGDLFAGTTASLYYQIRQLPDWDVVEGAIDNIIESDDIVTTARNFVIDSFWNPISHDEYMTYVYNRFIYPLIEHGPSRYQAVMELFDDVVKKFIFSDLDQVGSDNIKKLLREDAGYRQRRMEDLRVSGLYASMQLSMKSSYIDIHPSIEAGLPAYRIGASVLSDFALYTDANIPFSFWASNWTSYVTFGNHVPDTCDRLQSELLSSMLDLTGNYSILSYYSSRGILNTFHEQERKLNEQG